MTWSLLTSTEITKILDVFWECKGAARCLRCGPVRSRALAEQLTHKHAPKVCVFVQLENPFSPWRRTYSSGDGPLKVQRSPRAESHLSLGKESIQVPQHAGPTPAGAELTFPYNLKQNAVAWASSSSPAAWWQSGVSSVPHRILQLWGSQLQRGLNRRMETCLSPRFTVRCSLKLREPSTGTIFHQGLPFPMETVFLSLCLSSAKWLLMGK